MTGVVTKYARNAQMELVYNEDSTARGIGDFKVGLMLNTGVTALTEDSLIADVLPLSGNGYAQITLTSAWTVASDGDTSYPTTITFTASGGAWAGITGVYIECAAGELWAYQVNASAPIAIPDTQSYVADLTDILD